MSTVDLATFATVVTVDDARPVAEALADGDYPAMLGDECARLNAAGLTTCAELAFEPRFAPLLAGNIDASFGYLDTDATRRIGVAPGRCGRANYTAEQLGEIVDAYYPRGWQIAAHVHGDRGIETILDVYEAALARHPRPDHRLRLEHVGAIRQDQLHRAAALGVTASMFVGHLGARHDPAPPVSGPPDRQRRARGDGHPEHRDRPDRRRRRPGRLRPPAPDR